MVYDIQVIRDTDKYRQNIKIKKTVVKKFDRKTVEFK